MPLPQESSVTASTGQNGEGVVATDARLAARPSAPIPGRPTIDSNIVARPKWGRRRRYRCQACGKTGTPYHRLQHRRATFEEVAALSVEGLNKSAIARVKRIGWYTVDRWLERTAESCHRFNARTITGLAVEELQADELRRIVGGKQQPIWIFVSIDVWSRLWPSTVVGRRSYRNTFRLFRDVANRMKLARFPLIATTDSSSTNELCDASSGRPVCTAK